MFNEYDVVKAKRNLSESVLKGSEGTIVMIFIEPTIAYEVEFLQGVETLDILTVEEQDLELVTKYTRTNKL